MILHFDGLTKLVVGVWISKKALIPKNLKHTIWQRVLPSYTKMEVAYNAVENLSRGW